LPGTGPPILVCIVALHRFCLLLLPAASVRSRLVHFGQGLSQLLNRRTHSAECRSEGYVELPSNFGESLFFVDPQTDNLPLRFGQASQRLLHPFDPLVPEYGFVGRSRLVPGLASELSRRAVTDRLSSSHCQRFVVSHAKQPTLATLLSGLAAPLDHFRKRHLQHVLRELGVAEHPHDEPPQLLPMFQVQLGDRGRVELIFIGA
jgi:hypothetical protein